MGFLVIISFIVLFCLGFPIVVSLGLPSVLYVILNGFPVDMIAQRFQYSLDTYTLLAVPVFIFVGNLMNLSGVTKRIFNFAEVAIGRLPGGLAQVNNFASLIFSGMSGAALADIGGLGQVEITAMKEKGFSSSFSAAITAASATVGPIFPPSIPLVLYSSVTGTSLVRLLLGGIGPAILTTIALMIFTAILSIRRHYPRADRWSTLLEIFRSFLPALPALLAPAILVIGMVIGFFTPTEAASITVLYILIIGTFFYREVSLKHIIQAGIKTVKTSTSILIIFPAASLFGWVLTIEKIPQMFAQVVYTFNQNPFTLLLLVNIIFLVAGMFIGNSAAIILIVPIVAPPLIMVGIDPVHLGVLTVFNLMLGLITPPYCMSIFLVADVAKASIPKVIKDIMPFFIPLVLALIMITFVPQVVLWLPNLLLR